MQRWWNETARPSLDARRAQLVERRSQRKARKELGTADGEPDAEATLEVTETLTDDRPKMSRAEARARYLAAMGARAYSDEQLRLVAVAGVIESDSPTELRRSLATLPPDEVAGLLRAMVRDPSLLSEETLAELASVLCQRELRSARRLDAH